jgi:putative spermidine/putrescine transport system substrate-binding protein
MVRRWIAKGKPPRGRVRCSVRRGRLFSLALLTAVITAACGDDSGTLATDPADLVWEEVIEAARGTRVVWRMWRGDPSINAYVDGWVAPRLRELYDIELRAVEGQGPELVNQLVVERSARARGSADLVWINGETFHNLRGEDLLYGPWAGRLPNAALIDSASAIIMLDFEQDPAGYESPWGRVQFALIYDTTRTPAPPRTVRELGEWIRANPGRFTHDQSFTGTTFHKILMYALAGGVEQFQGGFDEVRYQAGAERLWSWLREHRPAFWREGTVYPAGVAELHRLFSNREVDFSMSYNENEVVTKVRQGILPRTARALVLRDGTIANAHYLGIPFNAPNPAGAMVIADFLLSPEAQFEKLKPEVWADGTVLDPARLPAEWRERFEALGGDPRSVPLDTLRKYAVPEVAPGYHERLSQEWRERIRAAPR